MPCTIAMRFVDTNVLLYSVSTYPAEAHKAAAAVDVLAAEDLCLSVQVLQGVLRAGHAGHSFRLPYP